MVNFEIKKLKISISIFFVPILAAVILYDFLDQYLITLAMISLHETGHIAAAVYSGARVYCLRVLPVGLNAQIDVSECSMNEKVWVYLAGPLTNLLLTVLCICLFPVLKDAQLLKQIIVINSGLAVFNLLPVYPLDGSRILAELLSARIGIYSTEKKLKLLSMITAMLMIGSGVLYFNKTVYTVSWIIVGIYLLFCITGNKRETTLTNMKNLFFKRSRIIKYGMMPVRQIAVMGNVSISKALRAMDRPGYFHLVYVLDENLRVKKVLTEQEILEMFTNNGPEGTLDN